jgi:hypothetical protein
MAGLVEQLSESLHELRLQVAVMAERNRALDNAAAKARRRITATLAVGANVGGIVGAITTVMLFMRT